jgi:hypothetical protein
MIGDGHRIAGPLARDQPRPDVLASGNGRAIFLGWIKLPNEFSALHSSRMYKNKRLRQCVFATPAGCGK